MKELYNLPPTVKYAHTNKFKTLGRKKKNYYITNVYISIPLYCFCY